MESFYRFYCLNNGLDLDSAIRRFHGYGTDPLCDEATLNKTLNDLQTVLPTYGEKPIYDEWVSKLQHLSTGQVNDGSLSILRNNKSMPSLIEFAEACYSARKNH